jgi:anti-sigma regulatory factor (Ser/Thr protein kinase)
VGCPDPNDWDYSRWYPCHSGFAPIARRGIRDFARLCGLGQRALIGIESAAGEAINNAIEHGHHPEKGIQVRARRLAGGLVVEVQDYGIGFKAKLREASRPALAPRGYGIRIMTGTMDLVEFSDAGRCVRLTIYDRSPKSTSITLSPRAG